MINLLINEYIKLFNKKEIYIYIFISFIFVLLTCFLYKYKISETGLLKNEENKINYIENAKMLKNSNNIEDKIIGEYILKTKYNINKVNDGRGMIINFYNEFELIIVVFVIIISSKIVYKEFNDKTISQLLIIPYNRSQILFSKYIISFLSIFFIISIIFIFQLLINIIIFKNNNFNIPYVVYNYNTSNLQIYNIFIYFVILTINKLPLFVLICTISFFIGFILNSNAAILITLILYIFYPILNSFIMSLNNKILNNFFTLHWDLSLYMFNITNEKFNYISSSFIICISILFFLILSFIYFNRKEIKNI